MTPTADDFELVGPVLEAGRTADAVIEAIRDENPRVVVRDRGSYHRVLVQGRCVVSRAVIEKHLGAQFELPIALERIMLSFKGRLRIRPEAAEWTIPGAGDEPEPH